MKKAKADFSAKETEEFELYMRNLITSYEHFAKCLEKDDVKFFKYLVEQKGFNIYEYFEIPDYNPLNIIILSTNMKFVKYLVEDCQYNLKLHPKANLSPVALAVSKCRTEIAKYLIEYFEPDVNKLFELTIYEEHQHEIRYSTTLAIVAVQTEQFELLKYLIEIKADLEIKDGLGCTMLLAAVFFNNRKMIDLLIEKKADIKVQNNCNDTFLSIACTHKNTELVKHYIKECKPILKGKDQLKNKTSLIKFLEIDTELFKYFFEEKQVIINKKLYPELLFQAITLDLTNMIKFFLGESVKLSFKNSDGSTLLHAAVFSKNSSLAEYLIDKNCDPNAMDNKGKTALHIAVNQGDFTMVQSLVNGKCDINMEVKQGFIPKASTKEDDHIEPVKFLENSQNILLLKFFIHFTDISVQEQVDFMGGETLDYSDDVIKLCFN